MRDKDPDKRENFIGKTPMERVAMPEEIASVNLLREIFKKDLSGIYLYGSAIVGGFQKYSDIDIFVIMNKPSTLEGKSKLVKALFEISGIYTKGEKRRHRAHNCCKVRSKSMALSSNNILQKPAFAD